MGNLEVVRSQLRHSKLGLLPSRRTKPTVSADYIVGLTDGEGCFYVVLKKPFNKNGGARVQLNFFIKVQEQDKNMLEEVKNSLECGAVYFQPENRINHSQCYRYTVNTHRDIYGVVIPFFKKHPLHGATKRKNFELFCRIAELVQKGENQSQLGISKIIELKSQMNLRTRVAR